MKFDLSEDQELLRSATADFIAGDCALESNRQIAEAEGEGFSRAHWAKLAELGYLGLIAGESVGGQGLGAVELAIVCHEMGKVCFPGPYLDVLIAAKAIEASGAANDVAAAVARGEEIVVAVHRDRVWPNQPASLAYRDAHVEGTAYFVPYGASADRLLVLVRDDTVLADGPFSSEPMESLEEMTRFAEVRFDNPARRLGDRALAHALTDLTAVGAAAHALGLCESAMQRTIAYSRERQTFGKPIGSYQGLQHRMADMLVRTESARSVVYHAAWSVAAGTADAALVAACARAYAVAAARGISEQAIQIHGGNGFTWEYDVHCFLKRALTLEHHPLSQRDALGRALAKFENSDERVTA
jgi:alkylation response protein AidB-like acyl-CoA dehydrogenase